jgi:hypothetical protein
MASMVMNSAIFFVVVFEFKIFLFYYFAIFSIAA